MASSSSGLGRWTLTPVTRARVPYSLLAETPHSQESRGFLFPENFLNKQGAQKKARKRACSIYSVQLLLTHDKRGERKFQAHPAFKFPHLDFIVDVAEAFDDAAEDGEAPVPRLARLVLLCAEQPLVHAEFRGDVLGLHSRIEHGMNVEEPYRIRVERGDDGEAFDAGIQKLAELLRKGARVAGSEGIANFECCDFPLGNDHFLRLCVSDFLAVRGEENDLAEFGVDDREVRAERVGNVLRGHRLDAAGKFRLHVGRDPFRNFPFAGRVVLFDFPGALERLGEFRHSLAAALFSAFARGALGEFFKFEEERALWLV